MGAPKPNQVSAVVEITRSQWREFMRRVARGRDMEPCIQSFGAEVLRTIREAEPAVCVTINVEPALHKKIRQAYAGGHGYANEVFLKTWEAEFGKAVAGLFIELGPNAKPGVSSREDESGYGDRRQGEDTDISER